MDELRVEIALDIIQRKIVHLLENNKGKDISLVKEELKTLVEEREKIYELDKTTINKEYDVYLEEIKKCENNIASYIMSKSLKNMDVSNESIRYSDLMEFLIKNEN